ncbi:MAG: DNA integrity scanning protein DisA nucleotide-binding domain protein [Nitrospinae bacterium]|nr:DNA integrity scanning protein DisA nucleotide-binding domain protein [Nitrospinota bacterium]
MGERAQPLSHIILEAACTIANTFKARALFLCSDSPEYVEIVEPLLEKTDIVLVTRRPESAGDEWPQVKHVLYVPNIELTRTGQIKIAVLMGLSAGLVDGSDRIVCVAGLPRLHHLDNILVLDLGKEFELLAVNKGANMIGTVRPEVFEGVLNLAIELANQGREGKPLGTIFTLGDHEKVLQLSRQLVINPFRGYPEEERNILDPNLRETIREFSAIDGSFVIRDDGVVITAGRHLNAALEEGDLPRGLGSRHVAAAGITAVTEAIAIAISESTGTVRIFKNGAILMDIEKASR